MSKKDKHKSLPIALGQMSADVSQSTPNFSAAPKVRTWDVWCESL